MPRRHHIECAHAKKIIHPVVSLCVCTSNYMDHRMLGAVPNLRERQCASKLRRNYGPP